jgi:hypothetical protein
MGSPGAGGGPGKKLFFCWVLHVMTTAVLETKYQVRSPALKTGSSPLVYEVYGIRHSIRDSRSAIRRCAVPGALGVPVPDAQI